MSGDGAQQADAIAVDTSKRGYRRSPELQERFDSAASLLLANDGYTQPGSTNPQLIADLALEGGGVKGIGLVGAILVLEEAGYHFRGVAGTSAGAIVASLVTALENVGRPMTQLKEWLDGLDFMQFMPEDKFQRFLHHTCGEAGEFADYAWELTRHTGLYNGNYLHEWLAPKLDECNIKTFADLRMESREDVSILPEGHAYKLLVHTSDITRGQLVRLPWDSPNYGIKPDSQSVVDAVRASMSIPFFFEPVTLQVDAATVTVPAPGGDKVTQHWEAGSVTWVDGGMLRNFPITAFDRIDDPAKSRWPTIGIKLSALQTEFGGTAACDNTLAVAIHCLKTMMNEWDTYEVDETTAARTIFVDHGTGITATTFDLSDQDKNLLFLNGVKAATDFVIANAQAGIPRNAEQAQARIDSETRGPASAALPSGTGEPAATR